MIKNEYSIVQDKLKLSKYNAAHSYYDNTTENHTFSILASQECFLIIFY